MTSLNSDLAYGKNADWQYEYGKSTGLGLAVAADLQIATIRRTDIETLRVFTEHRFG